MEHVEVQVGECVLRGTPLTEANAMRDRFRVEASLKTGDRVAFLFADEEAYEAANAHDVLEALHQQVGIDSAQYLRPDGYTPKPPRRLQIVGDGPMSVALREIRDEWTFGSWILDQMGKSRRSEGWLLIDAFDHYQDPASTSINEAYRWVANFDLENELRERSVNEDDAPDDEDDDEDEANNAFRDEFGMHRGHYFELLEKYARAFVEERLRQRGFPVSRRIGYQEHQRCEWDEVPRPDVGDVYFVVSGERQERVKIGHAKNIRKRIADLQTTSPYPLRLAAYIESPMPAAEESRQHRSFDEFRVQGEWFRLESELLESVRELRRKLPKVSKP